MIELLTIYVAQADRYQILSMNAPNLHLLILGNLYVPGFIAGLVVTIIVILVWIALYARKIKEFTPPLQRSGLCSKDAIFPAQDP